MTTSTPPLPARPWTRDDVPLAWRSDSTAVIGYPPVIWRLDDTTPDELEWLRSLAGDRTLDVVLADGAARGIPARRLRSLLAVGVRSGLIDDAAAMPDSLRHAVAAVRDSLEPEIASMRVMHGSGSVAREVIDRRRSSVVSVRGSGPLADAVCLALSCSGVGNVVSAGSPHSSSRRHRRSSGDRACQVLCDAAHPDGAWDVDAMALDLPHIAVTAFGGQAVVGPLVLPGRTSCLRCRDLHRADADPAWPRLTAQWAHRAPHTPPVAAALAHLAAAVATLQVLAVIDSADGDLPPLATLNGALVVTLPGGAIQAEPRPPHALCGCTWPSTGTSTG